MVSRVFILTVNVNDTDDGGFHEIHDIQNLSSHEHLLSTVTRIVRDNLKFGDPDYPLSMVTVRCGCRDVVAYLNNRFPLEGYGDIDILAEYDYDL